MPYEHESNQRKDADVGTPETESNVEHSGSAIDTRYVTTGPYPSVAPAATGSRRPTASELAYRDVSSTKAEAVTRNDAERTVMAAADVVQHERRSMISGAPARFHGSLELLYSAVTGHKGSDRMPGSEQVQSLDAAMVMLEPAISVFRTSHEDAVWLAEQLMTPVEAKRSSARFTRAMDRVDGSMRIEGKTVEIPGNDEPRKQGMLLHQQIQKLAPEMLEINEQFLRLNHHNIDKEMEALLEGEGHGKKLKPGSLVTLQANLWLIDGFLTLSDEEFQHELGHVQGAFNGVATYSELVKVATELLAGSVVTTASFAGVLAKLAGDSGSAALCAGVARSAGLAFSNVIAGVEIVHGVFVLLDPHASKEKKLDAAASVASGSAWYIGLKTSGATAGFAASTAIMLGYAELKYAAHLYWEASVGLTSGLMRQAFETMQRQGAAIAASADRVAKVGDLMASEADPANAADLKRVHDVLVNRLADDVDRFLDDAAPRPFESGMAKYPGAWDVLLELFGPLKKYKHAKSETGAVEGATETLKKIAWAMAHAGDLAVTSARGRHLTDLEHDLAKREHGGAEE